MRSSFSPRRSSRSPLSDAWLSLARLWRVWGRRDRAAGRFRPHLESLEDRLAPAVNVISTVAGTGVAGYKGDGGSAVAALLNLPTDIAVDASGDLFIADVESDVVREVNAKTGLISTVAGDGKDGYSGDGGPATAAELTRPTGVALDSSGDLFIADFGACVVREVNAKTGLISTVAGDGIPGDSGDGGPATAAQLDGPEGVAVDASGDLFIADWGNQIVREVNATTHVITTVAGTPGSSGYKGDGGPASAALLANPFSVAVDSSGDLFIADSFNNVVREVNAKGTITTVAGDGAAGYKGDGGLAVNAELNDPQGVAVDASGDLFIADAGNDAVREVNAKTGLISTVAGDGTVGYSGDGGPAAAAQLNAPTWGAVDSSGDLFITDTDNNAVRKVTASNALTVAPTLLPYAQQGTAYVETLTPAGGTGPYTFTVAAGALPAGVFLSNAGVLIGTPTAAGAFSFTIQATDSSATPRSIAVHDQWVVLAAAAPVVPINTIAGTDKIAVGYSGDGGPAASAELDGPEGVAVDSSGDLFIVDTLNNVVREVNGKTGVITTVAGDGTQGYSGDGGLATTAALRFPSSVAVDSSGDLFIADTGNNVVREVNAKTGVISTVAGDGTAGYSGDGGKATSAELQSPGSVAVDSAGDLFIADTSNNVVREVNATTHDITTIAGTGVAGFKGDGGPAAAAQLDLPIGVALDSSGDLFIADLGNNRVREVNATTHDISTVAGDGTQGYSGDGGLATAAELNDPKNVALDSSGDLFIADANDVVREVNGKTGVITTIAGDGSFGFGGDGGPAAAAELNSVGGLAVDSAGNLYLSDKGSNAVRKVTLTTPLTLSPAVLPPTAPLANYTQILTAGGGTDPYTFDLTAGGLPPGLTFSSNGLITGAATALGSYTFTVQAFDSSTGTGPLSAIRNYTIVVSPPISTVAGDGTAGYTGDGGQAAAAELSDPADVVLDASGNLYISDFAANVVREVNAKTGVITTIAGDGTAGYKGDGGLAVNAELNDPAGLTLDASGDLFIADSANNVVREVHTKTGVITTIAGTGTAGYSGDGGGAAAAELNDPAGLTLDASGDLFIADSKNYVVREVNATTHIISTVAGDGTDGYSGDGGKATSAELSEPASVVVDSSGDLFIADTGNDVVREVNAKTGEITTFAGVNSPESELNLESESGDGGPAAAARFLGPVSLALDASGDLFIGDLLGEAVREVNAQTGIITTVAGGTAGYSGDGGPATGAQLLSLDTQLIGPSLSQLPFDFGITLDPAGDLFIADGGNHVVRKVTLSNGLTVTPTLLPYAPQGTAFVETLAPAGGTGPYTFTVAAGTPPTGLSLSSAGVISGTPTAAGTFTFTVRVADSSAVPLVADWRYTLNVLAQGQATLPLNTIAGGGAVTPLFSIGAAVDSAGDVFVPSVDDVVREFNAATGVVSTVAGDGTIGYSGDGGQATAAELDGPDGVAVDAAGDVLYIADSDNDVIRKVNLKTGVISTFAGDGTSGYSGDGGPATAAELSDPSALALDSSGDLFIIDQDNNVVREVNAKTGVISTVAGDGTQGFSGDGGPATAAELNEPEGLAVDSSGDLFIADSNNQRVREVSAATGTISTVAGDGTQGFSGDGGPAVSAELSEPTGLAVDSSGDLLISDSLNHVVREVNAKTGKISTIIGDGLPGDTEDGQPALTGQLDLPFGLALDGAGNIYIADPFDLAIRKVTVTTPLTLSPAALPEGTEGSGYGQTITASGGTGPYSFHLTAGALPPGLALSAAGLILGTPTALGSYTFTVQAFDASTATGPLTAVQDYTLTVAASVLSLGPITLPAPQVGVRYSQTLTASGGEAPYTFTVSSGQLPAGLSLSPAGVLGGVPTAAGPFSFTIQAADSSATPLTGDRNYSFTVAAPTITLNPTTLPTADVGASYNQTIAAGGGTAPYTFQVTAGALPAGLTLSTAGVISGKPTAAGSATFTITATDSSTGQGAPFSEGQPYTLNVNTLTFSPTSLPSARLGVAYSQTITASGGTAPYTFQITAGALPTGMSLSLAGVLGGAPRVGGSFSFTVQATDSSATPISSSIPYALTVATPAPVVVLESNGELLQYDAAGNLDVLSPAGTIVAVSEVVDGAGADDIFAITTSGNSLYEHTSSGWSEISSGYFQQISAATDKSGNAVVFGVLGSLSPVPNSLFEHTTAGWSELSPAGTILSVSAVATAQGETAFAVVTSGDNLWQYSAANPQAPWSETSAGQFGQVSAGLNAAGQAVAYGVLLDNSLWEYNPAFGGTHWQNLSPAGTILSATAGGADTVFAITAGQTLWEHNVSVWSEVSSGSFASAAAGRSAAGADEVFAVLTDSSLWWYDSAFPLNPWENLLPGGVAAAASPQKG